MENGTLWDVIKRLIVSMIKTLTARREAYAAQAQREQAQMYQNQKTMQWNNAMKQIQQELFAVFSVDTKRRARRPAFSNQGENEL